MHAVTGSWRAGVALSQRASVERAVEDAATAALADVGSAATPLLVMAYGGIAYDQEALVAALRRRFPGVPLFGGSAQGIAATGRMVEGDRVLALAVLTGPEGAVTAASVPALLPDPEAAGRALATQLGPRDGHATTLLVYDPLSGANVHALLDGLSAGGHPVVWGGASGQPWGRMVRTHQYTADGVLTSGAVAVCLRGLDTVGDLTHGAESTGVETTVTRAEANVVLELDGRPALDVWCEQLGVAPDERVENTANWALGMRPPSDAPYEGLITRAQFKLDAAARAIILQAPVPVGARVQVCIRTQPAVFDGALRMADRLSPPLVGRRPVLALGFECGARPGPFLGTDMAAREIEEMQARLPPALPWLGMYAWGEVAPVGGRTEFHNFTFPLAILCEA